MATNTSDTEQVPATATDSGPAADDARWKAVSRRDAGWDGRIYFGVATTRVYCRPSCPARRPRRDRVRFFATVAAAEAAGYRPCLRCHPKEFHRTEGEAKAAQAAAYLESNPQQRISLRDLAARVGLSPDHLQRTFRRLYGQSPRAYQAVLRAERLKKLLKTGGSVAGAGYEAGFGSSRGVYEQAERSMGMSPARYRSGGKGLTIHYDVLACSVGTVLVGRTDRGVCCVLLGDDEASVTAALCREFPLAECSRRDPTIDAWTEAVVGAVAGRRGYYAPPPLDLQGTDFQRRVWAALQEVPWGQTATYTTIAKRLGMTSAARAVASACAANHAAVVVPCHRVVRSDGTTGGYKWGLERKRSLLERERSEAEAPDSTAS
jgi:AraC family transcriptional regulator, regulatory protein of adaptative response / methylated-DNA-[protein]-cysteine methyltransferase